MDNTNWWFVGFNHKNSIEGYGDGLGWLDPETQEAMMRDPSMPENPVETPKPKARRLVVLRGSYTAEVSGPPTMEIR